MSQLEISVVVATRNRPDALAMSLPLLLAQTRPVREIVVVDSSDDHAAVEREFERATDGTQIPVRLLRGPMGSCHQRNLGLSQVSGDVILFPDDDSLLFPNAVEELMRIYEADEEGRLAGVSCAASPTSPLETEPSEAVALSADKATGLRALFYRLEARELAVPTVMLSRHLERGATLPEGLRQLGCVPQASQFGFRMSFRADAIREHGFNEALGGYAYCEDRDACFAIFGRQVFTTAQKAKIYHHRFPGQRGNPYDFGKMLVMNQIYIVARHTEKGHPVRRSIPPYLALQVAKAFGYLLFGGPQRSRFWGAMSGIRGGLRLLRAPRADLDRLYMKLMGH